MRLNHTVLAHAALLAAMTSSASAVVTFEWVTVGNPGNANDPADGAFTTPGIQNFGSVAYVYRIAQHEVTNDQYAEFLNKVAATDTNALYNAAMGSSARSGITQSGASGSFTYTVKTNFGNKPVIFVSFFDAMRFVNWLDNGQPTGAQDASTTEDGVYSISDGLSETRAAGAQFFIPTENEWYKAAYHQPSGHGGDADDYWLYPTASNVRPGMATASAVGDISNPGTNVANYDRGADWNTKDGNVTTVGSAGALSESFYGTSDQGGNVWEWNEALVPVSLRGLRGGSWANPGNHLRSSNRLADGPTNEAFNLGFRVASPVGCGNGTCDAGEDCVNCPGDCGCVNGTCTAPDTCTCDPGWTGAVCSTEICGDGLIVGTEECDDGNTDDGDGCSSNCVLEGGCCPRDGVCLLTTEENCTIGLGGRFRGDMTPCGRCHRRRHGH